MKLRLFLGECTRYYKPGEGQWQSEKRFTLAPNETQARKGFQTALSEGDVYGVQILNVKDITPGGPAAIPTVIQTLIKAGAKFIDSRTDLNDNQQLRLALMILNEK
jgi:hypothetical protein